MYEFEFVGRSTDETITVYGYSMNDLRERYPEINFDDYRLVYQIYID